MHESGLRNLTYRETFAQLHWEGWATGLRAAQKKPTCTAARECARQAYENQAWLLDNHESRWDTDFKRASQVALVVKNLPAKAGDVIEAGSIPGLGRSPGGRHGNPLQYSCLENPMDRGAWRVRVHRVTKSRTRLKRLSMHAHTGFKKEEARIHNNVWKTQIMNDYSQCDLIYVMYQTLQN